MLSNNPIWLVVFATLMALVPLAVGVLTSYVKVNIILGFLRSGLGTQQVPGNLVMMALSLALTAFIMSPVIGKTMQAGQSIDSKLFEKTPALQDLAKFAPLFEPWREFMSAHSGKRELTMLTTIDKEKGLSQEKEPPKDTDPDSAQNPALRIVMPAFVLTEVKAGFMMGFMVLLPFLIIDLVVANILAGMGMYMLSPVIISLPLKLILFVMADGWLLLTKGIILSY